MWNVGLTEQNKSNESFKTAKSSFPYKTLFIIIVLKGGLQKYNSRERIWSFLNSYLEVLSKVLRP